MHVCVCACIDVSVLFVGTIVVFVKVTNVYVPTCTCKNVECACLKVHVYEKRNQTGENMIITSCIFQ